MDRRRVPMEFGFPTGPYIPPSHPRPIWRTVLFGGLLTLIPLVGTAVGAVYVDRRNDPESYAFGEALKTALLQLVAILVLALIVWFVFGFFFDINFSARPESAPH